MILYGVFFLKSNPMTVTGGELLRSPLGQIKDPPDYHDLMRPRITESAALPYETEAM